MNDCPNCGLKGNLIRHEYRGQTDFSSCPECKLSVPPEMWDKLPSRFQAEKLERKFEMLCETLRKEYEQNYPTRHHYTIEQIKDRLDELIEREDAKGDDHD